MAASPPTAQPISILPSHEGGRYGSGNRHVLKVGATDLHVLPVIFVPGVMGSRLKNKRGEKVWDPDDQSFMLFEYGLYDVDPKHKKEKLIGGAQHDPDFLKPHNDDLLHNVAIAAGAEGVASTLAFSSNDILTRGDDLSSILTDFSVMNLVFEALKEPGWISRNARPEEVEDWKGWTQMEEFDAKKKQAEDLLQKLEPALPDKVDFTALARVVERGWGGLYWSGYSLFIEAIRGRVDRGPGGKLRDAVKQHLQRVVSSPPEDGISSFAGRLQLPVYGFAYNWTNSCSTSGEKLAAYIDDVIERYQQPKVTCEKAILVTHSMGGLVARAACTLHDAEDKVSGVVHGVQPALGSAAMYWRTKSGFRRASPGQIGEEAGWLPMSQENPSAKKMNSEGKTDSEGNEEVPWSENVMGAVMAGVLGANGREVTALAGNMPGLLELAPSNQYRTQAGEKAWLKVVDETGKAGDRELERPTGNVYEDLYKVKMEDQKFWAMVDPKLLAPERPDDEAAAKKAWKQYATLVDQAHAFHKDIEDYAHPQTFNFYGGGDPVRRMGTLPGAGGKAEETLIDTATADDVMYRIRVYTWEDALEEDVDDTINQAMEGEFDPQSTFGSLDENLGSPEQMARAAEDMVEASTTGEGSGGLKGGKNAVSAGNQALGVGKEALEAAEGAYKAARSGFQEVLKACREAVEAAQHAADSSRRSIQATLKALDLCRETIEGVADTVDNAEQVLDNLLDEVGEHLEQEAKEALQDAYREAFRKAREAVAEGRRVLNDAIASAEEAAQEAARAAQSALAAGKQAFQAGKKALQDALSTGQQAAQKIEDASREALEAAEKALAAGRKALNACHEVIADALDGLKEIQKTALEVARHSTQAVDALQDVIESEEQDREARSHPLAAALRALREVLSAVEAARSTVEVARTATEEVLASAEKAKEALRSAVDPVREAFKAAEEAISKVLDASAQAMNRVVQQGKERLKEARSALNEGREQTAEHVESALSEADEALTSGWKQLDDAAKAVLESATQDVEEAPEEILERAWRMLEEAVQKALSDSKEDHTNNLDEVIAAVKKAYKAAKESFKAGKKALDAAQRAVDLGAGTLNDLLHASEDVAEKTGDAAQKTKQAAQAVSKIRVEEPAVENAGGDVQPSGKSPASLPAYPDKYQDGRVHPRYKRGSFEAYFAAEDGTVLKAVLEDPDDGGDSTVSVNSGRALVEFEKAPAEYPSDHDLEREERLFEDLMHEPAYRDPEAQDFTVERVVQLFAHEAFERVLET